ncbi:MAG: small multi-drug export protein [Candidatus Omnitrophota bacterium]
MENGFREYLITFILSLLPISELRGAIPYGFSQRLPVFGVLFVAVIGNFIPVVPVYLGIQKVAQYLSGRYLWAKRFFDWLFARTRRKAKGIEYSEFFGLAIFVGIPLPITGAWTGAIAASLLGIPWRRAFLSIFLGILIAATVVTMVCLGFITVFSLFVK